VTVKSLCVALCYLQETLLLKDPAVKKYCQTLGLGLRATGE
jgi:hypothetical protein